MANINTFPGISYDTPIDPAIVQSVLNNTSNTDIEITGNLLATNGTTQIMIDNPNLHLSGGGTFTMYMPSGNETPITDPGTIYKVGFKRFNLIENITFDSSLPDVTLTDKGTGYRFIWGDTSTVGGTIRNCTFLSRPVLFGDRSGIQTFRTIPKTGDTYNIVNNDFSNLQIEDCTMEHGWFGFGNNLTMIRCTQTYGCWVHGSWGGSGNYFEDCHWHHINRDGTTNKVLTVCKFFPATAGRSYNNNVFKGCTFEGGWEEMVGNDGASNVTLTVTSVGTNTITVSETPPQGASSGNDQAARAWGLAYANNYIGMTITVADKDSADAGKWFHITGYNSGTKTFTVTGGKHPKETNPYTINGLTSGDIVHLAMGFNENEYDNCTVYVGYAPPSFPEGTNIAFSFFGGANGNLVHNCNVEYKHGLTTLPTFSQWGLNKEAGSDWWGKEIAPYYSPSTKVPQTPASIAFHEYSAAGAPPCQGNVWEDNTGKDVLMAYAGEQHFDYPHGSNGSYEAPYFPTQNDFPFRSFNSYFTGYTNTGWTWNNPKLPTKTRSNVWDFQNFTWSNNDHSPDTTYSAWGHGKVGFSPNIADFPAFLAGVQVYPYYADVVGVLYGESYRTYDVDYEHYVYTDRSVFDNYAFDWAFKLADGTPITQPNDDYLNTVPIWGEESTTTFLVNDSPLLFDVASSITVDITNVEISAGTLDATLTIVNPNTTGGSNVLVSDVSITTSNPSAVVTTGSNVMAETSNIDISVIDPEITTEINALIFDIASSVTSDVVSDKFIYVDGKVAVHITGKFYETL